MNAFTHRPKESFAMDLQRKDGGGGKASAKRSKGIAVPGLSNKRGAKEMKRATP